MFYERFIQLCTENGEKPTSVLKEIGVSSGNLNNWKNGTSVKSDILMQLSEHFNVSIDYLLGMTNDSGNAQSLSQNEQELLDIFKKFSERDQIKILGKMEDWTSKVPVAPSSTSQPEKVQKAPERPWRMAARSSDGSYTTRTLSPKEVEIIKSLEDGPEDF